MTYTIRFDALSKDDIALAGGKGANLGEMSRAGLPVPPGFVITTRAYDAFVEAGGLRDGILGLAARAADTAALDAVAEEIHARFARTGIPEDVTAEILIVYTELAEDEAPVAARSSATAEDLPGASFAGQQETYLNLRGETALLRAVRDCWASLWTARAMAYRQKQGTDSAAVSLAVVQRMVEAEAAGILFTAHPVSGRRDRMVISAAWGLGEAVVGGRVTPDTLVVDSSNGRVISREIADKAVMTVYTEDGTSEKPVPEARRREPVLSDEGATRLARFGARIEELYGAPQDVEWALLGGKLFVLQARPITAPARLLRGPEDFGEMRPGEVLVAGITTPAWTPLFALASAVVTDVGGPLSHGSIVAREYGIPAVLGTGVATRRIESGQRIRVDGDAGTVTLPDEKGATDSATAIRPSPDSGMGEPDVTVKGGIVLAALAIGAAVVLVLRRRRRS